MADKVTLQDVEAARRSFSDKLKIFQASGGRYNQPAPRLEGFRFKSCEILTDRLAILDRLPKNAVCAEIGVDRAAFSREIVLRTNPRRLYLYDVDTSRIDKSNLSDLPAQTEIKIIKGDSSASLVTSHETFDWIYIDGDHRYESVLKDAEAALARLSQSGLLIFNDYTVWSPASMFHCGVARAVNEFCLRHDWEVILFCFHPLFYNDIVIRRRQI